MITENWIRKLRPLINAGWEIVDGKLQPSSHKYHTDLNWVFSNVDFDCTKWNKIYHEIVTQESKIHSHCHDCIKIVAKPKTLRELVEIETIQKAMLFPCKCGIDTRMNTQDIYGAFWYNRGFPEARLRYKEIRNVMDQAGLKHLPLIIKRGCTEFENRLGPSDQWKPPTPEQLEEETGLDNAIRYDPMPPNAVPEMVKYNTHEIWVEWAFQHGDNTYLEFTNGVPLHQPLVTYNPEDPEVTKLKKLVEKKNQEIRKLKEGKKNGPSKRTPRKSSR